MPPVGGSRLHVCDILLHQADIGAFVSRWKGVPHLWHLREFGKEDFGLVPCLGTGYEKWIYGKCERFVAISEAIRKAFLRVIDGSRITVVYNVAGALVETFTMPADGSVVLTLTGAHLLQVTAPDAAPVTVKYMH